MPKKVRSAVDLMAFKCRTLKVNACNHQPLSVTFSNNFCLHLQYCLCFSTDDKRLKHIFLRCKGRMEMAKSVLDMYFTARTHIPDVLCNRDPCAQLFKDLTDRM
jgi:hypothetical protein